ncbi:hypothetical protein TgHK011_008283 [Trichoderma gracile]|nr:hypothetical protein TgHK011_008283 [Trichoderma gracile]
MKIEDPPQGTTPCSIAGPCDLNNTEQHRATGSPPWKVINYQIPIPIGDCSAHFLVEKNTDKVRRAFIMDGGTNAGTYVAWVQILKALRFIDLQLGSDWKFDSWVVTHWDADHYNGVKDLLLNEGIKFTRCSGAGKPVTREKSGSFASLYFAEAAWLCCGAWDVEAMFVKGDDFLRHFVRQDKLNLWRKLPSTIPTKPVGNEGQSLLRCIWGEKLIGLDLFTLSYQYIGGTGKEYQYTRHTLEFERRLESDDNALAAKNTPRFCVVGANGYGIGQSDPLKKEKPSKNETSILALLYWKAQNLCSYYTGGDGNPGVFKEIVKPWFNKTWPGCDVEMVKLDHHGSTRENLGGQHFTKAKFKSKSEEEKQTSKSKSKKKEQEAPRTDPETIRLAIQDLKPRTVLVTPGTLHGHPTWDVIIFLRAYFEEFSGARDNPIAMIQGLFTTRAVYWLIKGEVSLKDINHNHSLGEAFEKRGRPAAAGGSNKMREEDEPASNDADQGDPDDEEDDNSSDSDFDISHGRARDLKDRQDAQGNLQEARGKFNDYTSKAEKEEKEAQRKRKGGKGKTKTIKYKFWLGVDAKKLNYTALTKAVKKTKEEYEEEQRKEAKDELRFLRQEAQKLDRMTPKKIEALRAVLEDYATDEYDQSSAPDDPVDVRLRRELCDAIIEVAEAADDTQQEGVEDFRTICWQPLPVSESDDPHFIIRFEFNNRRQDTVVQVFDDSGKIQYVKKPSQAHNGSGQQKVVQKAAPTPEGGQGGGSVEPVKQSETKPTGLLVEDDQNPWTKYAYGECAIATMLSTESIETPVKPTLGARGPKNMVFQYYEKQQADTRELVGELIQLSRLEKQRKNSTTQYRGRSRKRTDFEIAVDTPKKPRGNLKKPGKGTGMAEEDDDDESSQKLSRGTSMAEEEEEEDEEKEEEEGEDEEEEEEKEEEEEEEEESPKKRKRRKPKP